MNAKVSSFEVAGAAAKTAADLKCKKFASSFNHSTYEFRPLVVDTGGRMDENLSGLIKQVAKAAVENSRAQGESSKDAHQKSFGFFWRNVILVAIARGFARSAITITRQIYSRKTGKEDEDTCLEQTLVPCGYR